MVRVGVGCILFRDRKILVGLRSSSHGNGYWGFPGGHLEPYETPEDCAKRETFEETGLTIPKFGRGPWTNDIFESQHYITLFMIAQCEAGNPILMEPDKCKEWRWVDYNNLPNPLFLPIQNLLKDGFKWDTLCHLIMPKYNTETATL